MEFEMCLSEHGHIYMYVLQLFTELIVLPSNAICIKRYANKLQSQSYFMPGDLPPISSSWHQAPWDSWPAISFSTEPLRS
jgi:hypothetical protein